MEEIGLILYVIVALVSIISLVRYGVRTSRLKKIGKSVLNSITPHRTLTKSELESIKLKYKRGIKTLTADSKVFQVRGRYVCQEITYRHNTTRTHFLSGIEFLWQLGFKYILQEENVAEIVLNDKGKAIILTLNSDYVIDRGSKETDVTIEEEKVSNEASFITRELDSTEESYLNRSSRVLFALVIAISLFLFTIGGEESSTVFHIFAISIFLIGAIFYLIPWKNRIRGSVKLLEITGEIKRINGNYLIGQFPVSIDKSYNPEEGSTVTAQVYCHSKEMDINTLLKDENWSISNIYQFSGYKNRSKYIVLAVVLSLGLLINLLNGNIPGFIQKTINYSNTYKLQENFTSLEEIGNYDFKDGQNVNFSNIKIFRNPGDGSTYLLSDDYRFTLGSKEVLDRIAALRYIQYSELFLNLFVLEEDLSSVSGYSIALLSLAYENELSLYDFDTLYRDNEAYNYLNSFWKSFLAGGEQGDYWTLINNYNDFILKEIEYINSLIIEDVKGRLSNINKIKLLGDGDYTPRYIDYSTGDFKPPRDVFNRMDGNIPDSTKVKRSIESRINSYVSSNWSGHITYDIKGRMGLNNFKNEVDIRHFSYIFLVIASIFVALKIIIPGIKE